LEATLPERTLLVEQVALFLQLGGRVVKFTSELLVAESRAHLVVLEGFGHDLVGISKVADLGLVILDELLPLLFQVCELLLQNCILGFPLRCESNEAFLNILQLLPLGLVLGLSSLFFFQKSLATILKLTLHLILVNLDPILISLDGALVLSLHLSGFSFSELNLLLHQSAILLKVNVLVVQLILSLIQFTFKFIVSFKNFNTFEFILFFCLINVLLFLHDKVALRFNLVLKSDLFSFELCLLLGTMFILLDKLSPFTIMYLVLLINLHLVGLLLLIKRFSLFI